MIPSPLRAALAVTALLLPGPALAGKLTLSTSDGVSLAAESWGSGDIGVLLVHEEDRSLQDWRPFAEKLASNGFRVLAVDLRGHGGSTAAGAPPDDDWTPMVNDVTAGVDWLVSRGATATHVVGAKVGSSLALHAAVAETDVSTVTLLSPSLSAHGVKVSGALGSYGDRPMLLVASSDDALAARAATLLEQKATGPKKLALYPGNASGSRMLNTAPELEGLLVAWLNGTLLQATDPEAAKRAELKTDAGDDIETSGKRFEDR